MNTVGSVVVRGMLQQRMSTMTKMSLETVSGNLTILSAKTSSIKSEFTSIDEANAVVAEMKDIVRDLVGSVSELTTLMLGDAYAYKSIIESETAQVPVSSREQHLVGAIDHGHKVATDETSLLTLRSKTKKRSGTGSASKSMFIFKSTPSVKRGSSKTLV